MVYSQSQMPPRGGGAQGGAWQQNPSDVCSRIKQLIDDLRSDLFVALTLDRFVIYVNDPEMPKVTKDDVKACVKNDETVKIVSINGKEVMWLWEGWRLYDLARKTVSLASEYGEAVVIAEC